MIINRITVIAHWGQDSALARMHIDETKRFASPLLKSWRICQTMFGTMGQIALEFEFENREACDKFWADWWATPGSGPFMTETARLIREGVTNEIFSVVDRSDWPA